MRNITNRFNETKLISFAIYNFVLVLVLVILVTSTSDNIALKTAVLSSAATAHIFLASRS